MNLNIFKDEKLENLPKKAKFRENIDLYNLYDRRRGDYPYGRVNRWINSKLGLPFDKVLSEFVKLPWVPAKNRTLNQLKNHIQTNTFLRKDEVYYNDSPSLYGQNEFAINDIHFRNEFYVHPESGCIRKSSRTSKQKYYAQFLAEQAKTMRILGPLHQLLRINGIWFEVKGESKHHDKNRRMINENGTKVASFLDPDYVLILERRQLNKKELKKHGLTNIPALGLCSKPCNICGGIKCIHQNSI